MAVKSPHKLFRNQFIGLLVLAIIIIIGKVSFHYYKQRQVQNSDIQFIEKNQVIPEEITEFNPNDLDAEQWKKLGFSDKEVATILKYKTAIGGQFISKEQFKKCYPIVDRYSELAPYILLPETTAETKLKDFDFKKYQKKDLKITGKFNPDNYSSENWQNLGFTEKQANAILKYKNFLGGSFISKEKFRDCFIISQENYQKLAPYLLLPEKTPDNYRNLAKNHYPEKHKLNLQAFDPNLLDALGWQNLGFSEKQANVIINYKERNLKGSFKSLEDIQKCFVINAEKFEELKAFIRLNPENFKTNGNNNTLNKIENTITESKTDFSKIDINQISFKQLREFGFAEKDAAMLLSFRKKLGGFISKNQILETYEIDKDLAQKLIISTQLNSTNVPRYTLLEAPEEWLKNHPYFKFSADKIIYYRISNPDEKKIWKFLKVKPEYEAKMRMYLK